MSDVIATDALTHFVHRYWLAEGPRHVDPRPVHNGGFTSEEAAQAYIDLNESPDNPYGYVIRDIHGKRVNS